MIIDIFLIEFIRAYLIDSSMSVLYIRRLTSFRLNGIHELKADTAAAEIYVKAGTELARGNAVRSETGVATRRRCMNLLYTSVSHRFYAPPHDAEKGNAFA